MRQAYPRPGWVEHDAEQLWETVLAATGEALAAAHIAPDEAAARLAAVGITNQRETTILWERATGRPVAPAIVWQCRRTAADCSALQEAGLGPLFRERTGLVLDAYFSGTKIAWLLNQDPTAAAPRRGRRDRLRHGGHVAGLATDRRAAPRHRRHQRRAHPALQSP